MLVGKLRLLTTMLPSGLYLMLLASAVSPEVTLGRHATSSRPAPTRFPKRRRASMIIGSHSSQFSPYSRHSVRNWFSALMTAMGGGPVPALSREARRGG